MLWMRLLEDDVETFFGTETGAIVGQPASITQFECHLGTLALKTEDFSKKIGRFSKTRKWIY